MRSGIDPAVNASIVAAAVSAAADGGASMLFTPEMTNILDQDRARAGAHIVEEADDPVLAATREAARRHGMWVHLGSIAVRDGDRRANRGLVVAPDGRVVARYDKMHLFDADTPTGERWRESAVYRPGEHPVAVRLPAGLMGMSICYDLRFPDLYRALSDAGATLIAVPAAFTTMTGSAHWEVLLRARAIEASAFVVAAAQVGRHEDGRETYGHSLVVDPWGTVLLDMGEEPGLGFATFDAEALAAIRARMPVLTHRRRMGEVQVAALD